MKLTYIFHSGFVIEADDVTIIIDYYKDSDKHLVQNEILRNKGKIYVLSSHSHHDHFNPEILKWKSERPDIQYIFSKDILDDGLTNISDATYLDKLDEYNDANIKIKAFGSTDKGISFYIKIADKKIFHAGDLNNWHWNEESTDAEIEEATSFYLSELNLLAENVSHLNLAMFPVDPRLGKDYMLGAEQFVEKIKVDIFVPMHFASAYDKANAFSEYAERQGTKFFSIQHQGQSIDF